MTCMCFEESGKSLIRIAITLFDDLLEFDWEGKSLSVLVINNEAPRVYWVYVSPHC